jgi:hypothetical protein
MLNTDAGSLVVPVHIPFAIAAVLDRLQEVVLAYSLAGLQIGNGAGHLEDRVKCSGGETELLDRIL